MNKNQTENKDNLGEKEAQIKTPNRNILYRLKKYCFLKFPSFMPDPDRLEILRESRERDEKANLETEPPLDEKIDLRCIWAAEFYMPSQVKQLLYGFEKLGWNKEDITSNQGSPAQWIQKFRENVYSGGWFNLGPICRPGDNRFFNNRRTVPLPAEVDYAFAKIYSLTSSITCIVMAFVLNDHYSIRINQSLRHKRQTFLEPFKKTGYRILDPIYQKTKDIQSIRNEVQELCINWFSKHLPGIFASGLRDEFPTCEFMTLRKALPFPKDNELENEDKYSKWLQILDMNCDIDAWVASSLPSLKFALPTILNEKNRFHSILAAREDAFSAKKLQVYGGGKSSYVNYVDMMVNKFLSRWALLTALTSFERHLNNVRDSAILGTSKRQKPLQLLGEFCSHLSKSIDIGATCLELEQFANRRAPFENDIEVFKPSDPRFYRNKEITFNEIIREQIAKRSKWLANTDRSIRDLLCQYGNVLGASENIKLQKTMRRITRWNFILALVIVVLTVLIVYSGIKKGEIIWPW